jgi:phage tail sheath protein FI
MPIQPTYPGVYVEEVPSGVRTITGVATSITAFLGRAVWGPVNEPTAVNSFGDFERLFGGLHAGYPMSYSVRDFFRNSGSQALIVRLFKRKEDEGAADGYARLEAGGLKLKAASPGEWGKQLRAKVDLDVPAEVKERLGLEAADAVFNLTVSKVGADGFTERILNLSVKDSPRRLVRWDGAWPAADNLPKVDTGSDTASKAEVELAQARKDLVDAKNASKSAEEIKAKHDTVDEKLKALQKAEDDTKAANSEPLDATAYNGSQDEKTGLYALDKADLFNLLCIPPDVREGDTPNPVYQTAMEYCAKRRAIVVVDSPAKWGANKETAAANAKAGLSDLGLSGISARNAALYFPRVRQSDPRKDDQLDTFVPCGIAAGVMARTDVTRGVWKAPAGLDAALNGVQGLQVNLNDAENGMLNPLGINCLRFFPNLGRVVWGARTLRGADQLADEYKYIPVRRLALYIEESLYRGTQWVVFEPNDEPLWAQIRLNVGAFVHNLFRQGAFQGTTPRDAYFVKCDKETTTQNDINLGIVNIVVGFAPLKPAEFVIIKIQQIAGQIQT